METPQHRAAFGPLNVGPYGAAGWFDQPVQLWMLLLAAAVALAAGAGVGYMLGRKR